MLALCSWLSVVEVRADREACLTAHEEGQLLRMRGQYEAARDQLSACAKATCPTVLSRDCAALLDELEAVRPSVVFEVRGHDGARLADVRVFADGVLVTGSSDGRAVTLNRGPHDVWFEAPGHARSRMQITVRDGEKNRVVKVQLVPEAAASVPSEPSVSSASPAEEIAPPPDYPAQAVLAEPAPRAEPTSASLAPRLPTYVLGGAALAALGTGIVLGVVGKNEYDRLADRCEVTACNRDATAKGRHLYLAADIAFGASAALAVAAATVYLTHYFGARREQPVRAGLDASVGVHGATVAYRTSF